MPIPQAQRLSSLYQSLLTPNRSFVLFAFSSLRLGVERRMYAASKWVSIKIYGVSYDKARSVGFQVCADAALLMLLSSADIKNP